MIETCGIHTSALELGVVVPARVSSYEKSWAWPLATAAGTRQSELGSLNSMLAKERLDLENFNAAIICTSIRLTMKEAKYPHLVN